MDTAEEERRTEEPPRWVEVRSAGPSSVKAERRNRSASLAVETVVDTAVAGNSAAEAGRSGGAEIVAGRSGC